MSKLQELIRELCPDGVEYKKLGELGKRLKGLPITATQMKAMASSGGEIRIFAGGKTKVDTHLAKIPKANIITDPAVLVQSRGVIDFIYYDKPFTFKNEMWAYTMGNNVSVKFLYYYLKSNVETFRRKATAMGTFPQISIPDTENFLIPIPPLEVQEEIVRILDNFTNLAAELQAELQARQKQYEYYRNKLLSFNNIDGVEYKKLEDIGEFFGGLTGKSKEDFKDGNSKFITYRNVYANPSLNIDFEDKVKISDNEKQHTVIYGDILFTGSSETPDECGMSSVVTTQTSEKLYLNSFCFGLRLYKMEEFNLHYLKHILRSNDIREQIKKTASGVTRYNVSKKRFAKICIPVPPIEVQEEIVRILDKFDALVNDLSRGLPAEIAAVQEQYEYYRDKLLSFPRTKISA